MALVALHAQFFRLQQMFLDSLAVRLAVCQAMESQVVLVVVLAVAAQMEVLVVEKEVVHTKVALVVVVAVQQLVQWLMLVALAVHALTIMAAAVLVVLLKQTELLG